MYAVVDIETTGLKVIEDRITEVAIFIYDGEKIVDRFHSLINPERHLPEFITRLTGISNEMLADAPRFFEVAKDIVKITEGKVFVAHNAHFDYTFIKNEFKSLGYTYQRKTLCTVRLSRKLFPGLSSYALGKICQHFGISIRDRHRAQGDAEATCSLLGMLLEKNEGKAEKAIIDHEIKAKSLPPKISRETFDALPEVPGVYYMYDEEGSIIYIGKSINIKKRIGSHFSTNLNIKKSIEFKNRVADITYELTGSELLAELLESDEIKKHKPLFNRAQKRSRFNYGIFSKKDRKGYIQFYIEKTRTQTKTALYVTQNYEGAKRALYARLNDFSLCMKLCGLYKTKEACFDYSIKKCQGACIQEEEPESYNERALAAMDSFNKYARRSFIVATKGRARDERGIVCVEKGRYLGYGYIDESVQISNLEEAKRYITRFKDNRDVQKIIWAWIKKRPRDVYLFQEEANEWN